MAQEAFSEMTQRERSARSCLIMREANLINLNKLKFELS